MLKNTIGKPPGINSIHHIEEADGSIYLYFNYYGWDGYACAPDMQVTLFILRNEDYSGQTIISKHNPDTPRMFLRDDDASAIYGIHGASDAAIYDAAREKLREYIAQAPDYNWTPTQPYPDKILPLLSDGGAIRYDTFSIRRCGEETETFDFIPKAFIIDSRKALLEIYAGEPGDSVRESFGDEFFKDHIMIVVEFYFRYAQAYDEVTSFEKTGDTFNIGIKEINTSYMYIFPNLGITRPPYEEYLFYNNHVIFILDRGDYNGEEINISHSIEYKEYLLGDEFRQKAAEDLEVIRGYKS